MNLRLLPALLVALPLVSRTAPDLGTLLQALSGTPQGSLVTLADGEGRLAASLKACLLEEGLVELALPHLALGVDARSAALCEREGWDPTRARWAWLDRDGRVRLTATTLEGAPHLREQLLTAGWRDPAADLEAFLRRHPDHGEARAALATHLLQVAQRRMLALGARTGDLDPSQDGRIWGEAVRTLDRLLSDPRWRSDWSSGSQRTMWPLVIPLNVRHSPRMRDLARRHREALEALVLAHPGRVDAWMAWMNLSGATGRIGWAPLVRHLEDPRGGVSWEEQPARSVEAAFVQRARQLGAWEDLKAAGLLWREALRDGLPAGSMAGWSPEALWRQRFAPVLEAHLKLGEDMAAEALVRELAALGLDPALGRLAGDIAEACGKPEFAAAWKALSIPLPPATSPFASANRALADLRAEGQPQGQLLLAGSQAKALSRLAETALASESLGGARVRVRSVPEGAEREGLRGLGWTGSWAWVDGAGRIRVQGSVWPADLAETLRAAGLSSPIEAQKAWVKVHPAVVEGRWWLLQLLLWRARTQMTPFTQATANAQVQTAEGFHEKGVHLLRPLTEAEDLRIWGEAARLLADLADQGFAQAPVADLVYLDDGVRHSPLMRRAAGKARAAVASELARHPHHGGLWKAWQMLARVDGTRSLRSLLGSLEPAPFAPAFPPEAVLTAYVASCRAEGAWTELRDLLAERWLARPAALPGWIQGTAQQDGWIRNLWLTRAEPLVEAHLRLGAEGGAQEVLEACRTRWAHRDLPLWASQLALKCGKADLARSWAAMRL